MVTVQKRKTRKTPSTEVLRSQFEDWFQSPLGRSLLANERAAIHQAIEGFFGYHLLEIPVSHRLPVGRGSLVSHRIVAVPAWQTELPEETVVSLPDQLPLESSSMDVVILHHSLDYAKKPHHLLREVSRVLVSGGHLVVISLNPTSLWGLRKLIGRRRHAPWNGRFISRTRLEDWLTLLDFSIHSAQTRYFQPPINHAGWLQSLNFLERWGERLRLPLGAYQILVAQKRVAASIPLKPKWRPAANVGTIPAVNRWSQPQLKKDT